MPSSGKASRSTNCFTSHHVKVGGCRHRHVTAARPDLVRLLTIPPPLQHIMTWLEVLRDLDVVNDLEVGKQEAAVRKVRAAAWVGGAYTRRRYIISSCCRCVLARLGL